MNVASSDDFGLVEVLDRFGRGLDVQFSSYVASRCLQKNTLMSREERSYNR